MKDIKMYFADIIKAFLFGLAIAVGIGVLSLIIGLLVSGFNIGSTINIIRAGVLISGAMALFVVAGILLTKKDMIVKHVDLWKKHFKKLSFVHVLSIISIAILIVAIVFDYATFALQ